MREGLWAQLMPMVARKILSELQLYFLKYLFADSFYPFFSFFFFFFPLNRSTLLYGALHNGPMSGLDRTAPLVSIVRLLNPWAYFVSSPNPVIICNNE